MLKDAETHSEYVTLIAFPRQQRLLKRVATLRLYVPYIVCLVIYSEQTTRVSISTVGMTGNSYPPLAQLRNSTALNLFIS
jgi:hypothetical protein